MLVKDDFDRKLYCIVGLPVDAESVNSTIEKLNSAIAHKNRIFLTTPNLNFAIYSLEDPVFRNSVINSNLVVVDGMPLIIIARLLNIPMPERVAGATLFECLSNTVNQVKKIKVFFFGGLDGVAKKAHDVVNSTSHGVESVGFMYPGFRTAIEMSDPAYLDQINQAAPDFLVVSLGAKKGQIWIENNLDKLNVPVVSHLGAVVNFTAGTLSRAPKWIQEIGFEWLWRIKEEPALWKRYLHDGLNFLFLFFFKVLPLALLTRISQTLFKQRPGNMTFFNKDSTQVELAVNGHFLGALGHQQRYLLKELLAQNKDVIVNLQNAGFLDNSFFAYMLIFNHRLTQQGNKLKFVGIKPFSRVLFNLNCVSFLFK